MFSFENLVLSSQNKLKGSSWAYMLPGFDEQPGRDNIEYVRGHNLIDPMKIYVAWASTFKPFGLKWMLVRQVPNLNLGSRRPGMMLIRSLI